MDPAALITLALACAPAIHLDTTRALVEVESARNPWAIGVVGGQLLRQPRSHAEGIATARQLKADGIDFSVGLGQINVRNFPRLGVTLESAFEPCINLRALQAVLADCFERASASGRSSPQAALRRALSCYYSGNFTTGFHHGYVHKVVATAARTSPTSPSPTAIKE